MNACYVTGVKNTMLTDFLLLSRNLLKILQFSIKLMIGEIIDEKCYFSFDSSGFESVIYTYILIF